MDSDVRNPMKPNMIRLAAFAAVCMLAGIAYGDFQIKDPAGEIMDELQNEEKVEPPEDDAGATHWKWTDQEIGDTDCSQFLASRQERSLEYPASLYWLTGFIAGAGYERYRMVGDSRLRAHDEPDSLALWIENYCQFNPKDSLTQAAESFVEVFGDRE